MKVYYHIQLIISMKNTSVYIPTYKLISYINKLSITLEYSFIMAKDYKKDPTTVKNYNELIEKLKLIDVSPQEAYSLAYKKKIQL